MKKLFLLGLIAIIGLLSIPTTQVLAQVPRLLNFSGNLWDNTQNPPVPYQSTGEPIVVEIFDQATGGVAIWSDQFQVDVENGYFSVNLGSGTEPLDLEFDKPYYVQVKIGNNGTPSERVPLTSSAYALNAQTSAFALEVADGSVTQDKLAPGVQALPIGPAGGDLIGSYPNPEINPDKILESIEPGSITQDKLAPNVTTPPSGPASGDLTGSYPDPLIAPGAVRTDRIADGAVTSQKIASRTILNQNIVENQIDNFLIDNADDFTFNSVTTTDGTTVNGDLLVNGTSTLNGASTFTDVVTANNGVTITNGLTSDTGMITSATVTTLEGDNVMYASGTITDVEGNNLSYSNGTITNNLSVGNNLNVSGTITGTLANNLTQGDGIIPFTYNNGAATTVGIANSGVTNAKIADGAVTEPKIGASNAAVNGYVLGYNGTNLEWVPGSVETTGLITGDGTTGDEIRLDNTQGLSNEVIIKNALGTAWTTSAINGGVIVDGSITTDDIANGTIANIDISNTAAIAYSKLNLANSVVSSDITDGTIVDADINAAAAIAYSKLNLANSIVSTDIVDGTIVNADIGNTQITSSKLSSNGQGAGQVLVSDGAGNVTWTNDPLALDYAGTYNGTNDAFSITHSGSAGKVMNLSKTDNANTSPVLDLNGHNLLLEVDGASDPEEYKAKIINSSVNGRALLLEGNSVNSTGSLDPADDDNAVLVVRNNSGGNAGYPTANASGKTAIKTYGDIWANSAIGASSLIAVSEIIVGTGSNTVSITPPANLGDPLNFNDDVEIGSSTNSADLDVWGDIWAQGSLTGSSISFTSATFDNLNITNDLAVGGNSTVTGNSTVNGTSTLNGATSVNNTLNVTGATTINNSLIQTGSGNQVSFAGNVDASNGLDVTGSNLTVGTTNVNPTNGNTAVGGTLSVTGTSILSGATTVANTLTQTGSGNQVSFAGNVDATNGLDVTGANLTVGTTNVNPTNGNTAVGGTLSVTGTSTLSGATTVANTLTQTGSGNQVSFAGNVDATNGLDVTGANLTVGTTNVNPTNGNTSVGGTLSVTGTSILSGATTVANTLTQTGSGNQVSFAGNVDATNGLDVTGANLTVGTTNVNPTNGNTAVGGTLTVTGATTLAGLTASSASVTGNTTLDGNLTVGGTLGLATGTTVNQIVTSITSTSTDDQLPTAEATWELVQSITANNGLTNNSGTMQLGGNLIKSTTITTNQTGDLDLILNGTGEVAFYNGEGVYVDGILNVGNATNGGNAANVLFDGGTVNFTNAEITQTGSGKQVSFAGNVDATNGLDVTGSNLTVGSTNINPTNGNTSVGGTLSVTGTSTLSGGTTVANTLTQTGSGNQVSFAGNVNATNGLDVTGANLTVGTEFNVNVTNGNITTTGSTNLGNATASDLLDVRSRIINDEAGQPVSVIDDLDVTGGLDVDGNYTSSNGNITLTNGAISLNAGNISAVAGNITAGGNMSATNNISAGNNLTVGNISTFNGIATFNAELRAQNAITNTSGGNAKVLISDTDGLDVRGVVTNGNSDLTLEDNVIITGTTDLRGNVANSTGDLNINDNVAITGTLAVTGNATFDGNVTLGNAAGDAITSTGAFTVSNGATIQNGLTANSSSVTGNSDVDGNLNVEGNFNFDAGQTVNEIVTTVSGASTDNQLPTAEAVWEAALYSANNGITLTTKTFSLGGNLNSNTTITNNGSSLTVAGGANSTIFSSTGDVDFDGHVNLDRVTVNTTDGNFEITGANRVTATSSNAAANAIDLDAIAGGVEISAAGTTNISSSSAGVNAVTINASAGGVDLDAAGVVDIDGGTRVDIENLSINSNTITSTTDVQIGDNTTITGTLTVTGNLTGAAATFSTLSATGAASFASTATFTGATNFNGAVTLGDASDDVLTMNGTIAGANPLVLEGTTADGNETTISVIDPTADRTLFIPNNSGTFLTTGNVTVNNGLSYTSNSFQLGGNLTTSTTITNNGNNLSIVGNSGGDVTTLFASDGKVRLNNDLQIYPNSSLTGSTPIDVNINSNQHDASIIKITDQQNATDYNTFHAINAKEIKRAYGIYFKNTSPSLQTQNFGPAYNEVNIFDADLRNENDVMFKMRARNLDASADYDDDNGDAQGTVIDISTTETTGLSSKFTAIKVQHGRLIWSNNSYTPANNAAVDLSNDGEYSVIFVTTDGTNTVTMPSNAVAGQIIYIFNKGAGTLDGIPDGGDITTNTGRAFIYDGTSWLAIL